MRPFGRVKTVKGGNEWKKDYHLHKKNRKLENWWEDITDFLSRSSIKRMVKKYIDKELLDN